MVALCVGHGARRDESLCFLDVLLLGAGFRDDLIRKPLCVVELPHAAKCLEPALVDNKLVSGVGVGGCDFERLVEVTEPVIIGAHLHVGVPDCS